MGKHPDAPDREVAEPAGAPGGSPRAAIGEGRPISPVPGEGSPASDAEELDLRGEVCPYTFLKARLALEGLPGGALLRVLVDNEASARDVPRSLAAAGHTVLECAAGADAVWAILTRRAPG